MAPIEFEQVKVTSFSDLEEYTDTNTESESDDYNATETSEFNARQIALI